MPQEILSYGPSFVGATLIVLVQIFVPRFHFLDRPQSVWPDFFSGVGLGYIFVDVLPHLASKQQMLLAATDAGVLGFLEHHAYLLAMAGFLLFLAIVLSGEKARAQRAPEEFTISELPVAAAFGATSMAAYSLIIGYILAEQCTHDGGSGLGFGLAMAAHFVGLGHLYRHLYPRLYEAGLRYVLAGALYAGWLCGAVGELSDPVYALLFTFLAGGIMIVTTVFELPRVKSWRQYAGFCAGAIVFSALILAV